MDKRLYIAYGSNLNMEQMKFRCTTAKICGKGILKGYRLIFKGAAGNAYLTIELFEGGEVPVVLWDIKPRDEMALDRYEGFPSFYYKENMEVDLETGEVVEAMMYIMTNKMKDRIHLNLPSKNYLATVLEGYKDHGFNASFIEEAIEASGTREF